MIKNTYLITYILSDWKGEIKMIKHVLFGLIIFFAVLTLFSKGTESLVYGSLVFVITMLFGKEVEADEDE